MAVEDTLHCCHSHCDYKCQWSRVGNSAGCGADSVDVGWQQWMWFLYLGYFVWVFLFRFVWVVGLFHFYLEQVTHRSQQTIVSDVQQYFLYNICSVRSTGGLISYWQLWATVYSIFCDKFSISWYYQAACQLLISYCLCVCLSVQRTEKNYLTEFGATW